MWHDPLTWTLLSILVYALATNLHWASHAARRRPGKLADFVSWWDTAPRASVARGLYLFVPPAAAVLLRVATPAQLGLVLPRSGVAVLAAALMAAITIGVIVGSRRSLASATDTPLHQPTSAFSAHQLGNLLLGALLLEAHWALFRAGGLSALDGSLTPGAFLALALLATEAWSNPWRRIAFLDGRSVHELSAAAALAVMSASVFIVTGSSIVALVLHVIVGTVLLRLPIPAPVDGQVDGMQPMQKTDPSATALES